MADKREVQSNFNENTISAKDSDSDKTLCDKFSLTKSILAKSLEKFFSPARFEKFVACLSDVREKNPFVFDSVLPQLIQNLQTNMKEEVDLMFQQENFRELCEQLDDLVKNAPSVENPWRPSGDPSKDIVDHVVTVKMEYRDKLKGMLEKIRQDNDGLKQEAMFIKTEILDREKKIVNKHHDLETMALSFDSLTSTDNGQESLEDLITDIESMTQEVDLSIVNMFNCK